MTPREQHTTRRRWHSRTLVPISKCPRCYEIFTKQSPRQKFCTIRCQRKDSEVRRPKRAWGKPEYYERRKLAAKGLKRCKECREVFHLDDFWSEGKNKNPRCKICAALEQKRTRKPDKNKNAIRARSKRWRELHPELFARRIQHWRMRNRERSAEISRCRRARKRSNGVCAVTARDLERLWVRQDGECYICHVKISGKPHLDHIIPIARGGRHAIGNLAWTHPKCNRNKHAKLFVEIRYRGRK